MSDYKDISNIYIYRVLGVFVNFGSMFIVVPFLASDPESYAIYAFAMSLSFFLTYGDLGFVGAAQKYCAEAVGRGRLEQELEYVGFMVAVLGIVAGLFASLMIMAAFNPQVLLPQLDQKHVNLASILFLTMAILLPIQVLVQRFVALVLASRLKDFYAIRIDLVANILKIIIAPMFDSSEGYLLEYYFITSTAISIISALVSILVVRFHLNFPVESVIRYIKFSHETYSKMRNLAFSSLVSTILFILYYEFDLIIGAQFYSLEALASYAIAFTLMNFIRTLSSIIYSPLLTYVNRLYGHGEKKIVDRSFSLIVRITVPLFMAVTIVLVAGSETLIFQWLDSESLLSVEVFKILLAGVFFVGFVNITPLIATTFELNRVLILTGLVPFVVYFFVFFVLQNFFPELGVIALAYAKACSSIAAALFGIVFLLFKAIIKISTVFKFFLLTCVSGCIYFGLYTYAFEFMAEWDASLPSLLVLLLFMGGMIGVLWCLYLLVFSSIRRLIQPFAIRLSGLG